MAINRFLCARYSQVSVIGLAMVGPEEKILKQSFSDGMKKIF